MRWQHWGPANRQWRGDAARATTQRQRCIRLYELGPCEAGCGADAVDRHHVNADPGDNSPGNVQRLCRRCHMLVDGRLAAFATFATIYARVLPPRPCVECRRLAKPLRRGLCPACEIRARRSRAKGEAA